MTEQQKNNPGTGASGNEIMKCPHLMKEHRLNRLVQSVPFWTLVVIQFWYVLGTLAMDGIPLNLICFAAFAWGIVIGILAEKGGLHPFNYYKK